MHRSILLACLLPVVLAPWLCPPRARADDDDAAPAPHVLAVTLSPSGQRLTPGAAPGARLQTLNPHLARYPHFLAGQAVTSAVSPDGHTLAVLTSGYNRTWGTDGKFVPSASDEYVFLYDISRGRPRLAQVLKVPDTYLGLAFAPHGRKLYVSGGMDDDVHVFARGAHGRWAGQGRPIALGHAIAARGEFDPQGGVGLHVKPEAAGLAVTPDGRRLVVANYYNDSLSLVNLKRHTVTEIPLRPGIIDSADRGKPGGEYPVWVVLQGNNIAYVSSQRDREVDVVRLHGTPRVVARIAVDGNPNRMLLGPRGRLYVACDNEAEVSVIDTASRRVVDKLRVTAPSSLLGSLRYVHGTVPDNLALSPDGSRLYVTDAGINALAVVTLNTPKPEVTGLIPTGYYPDSVSVGPHGRWLYVANGESLPGPNPGNCSRNDHDKHRQAYCRSRNAYILQDSHAGLLSLPVPGAEALANLTHLVARNDHFGFNESAGDRAMMAFLHAHIRHVIYVVRENRTYDQILGDLGEGNGDAKLAEFGRKVTPNAHALARRFVDLDNFYDTGDVSGNGWAWSTAARESDAGEKNVPVNYAWRGLSYDWEGDNRNVNVALPTLAARRAADPNYPDDPNLLPGSNDVAAPDGPAGQRQRGYLWSAALRAGLSVRNYGFFIDLDRYDRDPGHGGLALVRHPHAHHERVAVSTNPQLAPRTDAYFWGFNNRMPDVYREDEWAREFAGYVKHHDLPSLELVRLMHDHLGNFDDAIDGVDTPDTQVADNDLAVGRLIQTVAHSPYADSTLVFVVEDDAQDGPDHVDAHRSEAFVVGPYVRRHAVVSARYTTINMIRTIEDVLGIGPMTLNDAYERPMAAVFDRQAKAWDYHARIPAPLSVTRLPVAGKAAAWHRHHAAAWWAARTRGYDWHREDRIPALAFDHLLWKGLRPGVAYPTRRDGRDDRPPGER